MPDRRDDFSIKTKELLAKRVGFRCSNPSCRQLTSGPHNNTLRSVNVGVAAHISAASSGGPRFNPTLSSKQRKAVSNGLWLCQKCAKLIDNDTETYTAVLLIDWKSTAEKLAKDEIEGTHSNDLVTDKFADRRLEALERLFHKIRNVTELAMSLIENDSLPREIKEVALFEIGHNVAKLTDEEGFYLPHELRVHSVASFIGLEDIVSMEDVESRKISLDLFHKNIRNVYRMIESLRDSGKLEMIIRSPSVDYYLELRKQQDQEDQSS